MKTFLPLVPRINPKSVQYGEMAKLKEFIENGTNMRTPDTENVTLLHWTAINNRIEIVK